MFWVDMMLQRLLSGVVSEDAPSACVVQTRGTGALTDVPPTCAALKRSPGNRYRCKDALVTIKELL